MRKKKGGKEKERNKRKKEKNERTNELINEHTEPFKGCHSEKKTTPLQLTVSKTIYAASTNIQPRKQSTLSPSLRSSPLPFFLFCQA